MVFRITMWEASIVAVWAPICLVFLEKSETIGFFSRRRPLVSVGLWTVTDRNPRSWLPPVEATGCNHTARCPLAVWPFRAALAGPMGCLDYLDRLHVTILCREPISNFRRFPDGFCRALPFLGVGMTRRQKTRSHLVKSQLVAVIWRVR